jgi:hypothetical protein
MSRPTIDDDYEDDYREPDPRWELLFVLGVGMITMGVCLIAWAVILP